jgi:ABC-type methionine transport system ATPase subunit
MKRWIFAKDWALIFLINFHNITFLDEDLLNVSMGQRQHVDLAKALFAKPDVLLFDDFLLDDKELKKIILGLMQKIKIEVAIL